jgi:hypothetical protein
MMQGLALFEHPVPVSPTITGETDNVAPLLIVPENDALDDKV